MANDERIMWVTLKLNGSETPTTARKMYVRDAREFAEALINFDESALSYEAFRHCGGMLKDIGKELLKIVEKEGKYISI